MQALNEQDLIKIKELLRHTGEFIAYFELAETKMIAWRQEIEAQAEKQQSIITEQLDRLQKELSMLQEVLTQAGLARLRLTAEQNLQQGKAHLETLEKTGQHLLSSVQQERSDLNKLLDETIRQIEERGISVVQQMDQKLADYDIHQFQRVTGECCDHVERAATHSIQRNQVVLRSLQWRVSSLALLAGLISAFAVGLYVNNEWPWEMHQHARTERQAGQLLLKAWPILNEQEQNKIFPKHTLQINHD